MCVIADCQDIQLSVRPLSVVERSTRLDRGALVDCARKAPQSWTGGARSEEAAGTFAGLLQQRPGCVWS
jgi:hypothetical protein